MSDQTEITRLLNEAAQGNREAARDLFPLIYRELRKLASTKLSHVAPGGTLQTTALVHEAYIRIVGRNPTGWENVRHFYFTASRAMQDILVEDARRRSTIKRGGDRERVEPTDDSEAWAYDVSPDEVLALGRALERLEKQDPDGYRLVLLYFYSGLNFAEIADVLGVSVRTVERKWRFLRTWLAREVEPSKD